MERAQPISGLPCSGPAHSSTRTSNIRSAVRCSAGIYIESGSGGAAKVAVNGNTVDKYGSAGVVCNGASTACTVTGNTLRGRGPVDDEFRELRVGIRRIGVGDALQSAVGLIEARADYNAPEHSVSLRVGGHEEKIYLERPVARAAVQECPSNELEEHEAPATADADALLRFLGPAPA
jgi:hypothetical protein